MSKCYWCGKPSTRLCNFPVEGEETLNEQGKKYLTFVYPICEECATKYHGLDVCPECFVYLIAWVLENKARCLDLVKMRRAGND